MAGGFVGSFCVALGGQDGILSLLCPRNAHLGKGENKTTNFCCCDQSLEVTREQKLGLREGGRWC